MTTSLPWGVQFALLLLYFAFLGAVVLTSLLIFRFAIELWREHKRASGITPVPKVHRAGSASMSPLEAGPADFSEGGR
jgi:hypothetical protein